jgi:anthranilate synthase component 2
MNALLIDAYDSFVYIIRQYLLEIGASVEVVRNDRIDANAVVGKRPDLLVLGPGPGHPKDAGYVDLIQRFAGQIPIFGVCLGHQAIGLAYGGEIARAQNLMHGKTSAINHDEKGCFSGLKTPGVATRYHSLVVREETIPDCLEISAWAGDDGYVMGLRHRTLRVEGIQFHPESICTKDGAKIIKNFVTAA